MKCDSSQNSIMQYYEKRLSPLKSLALHRHIHKCEDCRGLLLAMDEVSEIEEIEIEETLAPIGFTDAIMAKISKLPAHEAMPKKAPLEWMRFAGSIYILLLALGFSVLYHFDILQISGASAYTSLQNGGQAEAFFSNIAQLGTQAASYTADALGGFGIYMLALSVILGLALVFMVQKEKSKI